MNHDWQHWIDRLKSDDLTEAELREFEEAVRADPANREAYLSALVAEVALEADGLPDPFAKPKPVETLTPRWPRIAAMAAGIAALAALSYFVGGHASSSSVVATITDTDDLAEKAGLRIGQPLEVGRITLPEGSEVGVAMRGGARLKIRGPASFDIDGPDRIRLDKGRLSTYAPSYARGFTVDTVDGKVIDLGTRFVTAVDMNSGTEIHVLEGLVTAHGATSDPASYSLEGERAGILRQGRLEPTEFLAQRLLVPLDPVLQDRDSDGFPDEVENHYNTPADDPSSHPEPLRIEESFAGYPAGPSRNVVLKAKGASSGSIWEGEGIFQTQGLSYTSGTTSLRATGGSVATIGELSVGATLLPDPKELSPIGVTYVSFLMKNPASRPPGCFAGLLLYQDDREQFFVGKLSVDDSYGSRLRSSPTQDSYGLPMDDEPHLFVIRIDRTRLVTDIYFDPVPGQSESSATRRFRYQAVPEFDRIAVRSGSKTEMFPSSFDEIRVGLTWDSVVPGVK
ncbi:FecR domain-containing protein [Luteolibacter yonseiensis]|uniref:FecR domain-containing protein n=1 Tax=Luteolibacter yonseiensis TaxID=1144680 RepID=A0A934V913_9BACT|nr:FecR domain-containing protein [Luteolibacter yonseiensis]MBK1814688.1 FecR domain-containing protein [Luteolibacter yonseiensis]